MDSLTLKLHDSFQNENNRKATHSFPLRPLTFKLQQEVLKFSDIVTNFQAQKIEVLRASVFLLNSNFQRNI